MNWKIPLFKVHTDHRDIQAVAKSIGRKTHWAIGPEIELFEKKLAKYVGTKYALVFNSGTSALYCLYEVCGLSGKEVIIPSFTFIATANPLITLGAKPIFAESEYDTFALDAKDVEGRINKKTKAIVVMSYGGFPARDMLTLKKLAKRNKLLFIEDAAQSFGAKIGHDKVGTFGDAAIFSFCQNKVLTTGEGGAITTNSREIYEKAKLLRSHGRTDEDYFSSVVDSDYIVSGYNFRMPSLCAALGISQLKKIKEVISLRRLKSAYLTKQLSEVDYITTPKEVNTHFSVYQMYTIRAITKHIRDKIQRHLTEKGVMNKVYFVPVHLKKIYRKLYGYKKGDLPQTERLSDLVLNIPLFPDIEKKELDYIANSIKEIG